MKKFVLLSLFLTSLIHISCTAEKGKETIPEKETIFKAVSKTVEDNCKFLTDENLEKFLSTIHSESLGYQDAKKDPKQLFDQYDLVYTITSKKLLGYDSDYAYIRVTQVTKKVKGPAFRDNSIDVIHVLKKENGIWKIWSGCLLSIQYLENSEKTEN